MMLIERDLQIADVLACRVRVMEFRQIAAVWWDGNETATRRRLTALVNAGVIDRTVANVCPRGNRPRFTWSAGDRTPDIDSLREHTRRQWLKPTRPCELFSASKLTANLFGQDAAHFSAIDDRNRQLLLSDAFVNCTTTRSMEASHWHTSSTENMEESGQGRPDVLIAENANHPARAIATLSGSPRRLEELHSFCADQELPYELW